jgi:hypothetical protein
VVAELGMPGPDACREERQLVLKDDTKGAMQLMCHLGDRTGMRGGPSLGDGYCGSCSGREALLGNNAYSSARRQGRSHLVGNHRDRALHDLEPG